MKPARTGFLLLFFVLYLVTFSQQGVPKFISLGASTINERPAAIVVKADGSYFVGASKNDSAMVLYMSSTDTLIWAKTFRFNSSNPCYVNYLGLTSDGYLIGSGYVAGSPLQGAIFKINPTNGTFLWNNSFNGNSQYVTALIEKSVSEYICVGGEWATVPTGVDAKNVTVSATTGAIISQSSCYGYGPYNWLDDLEGWTGIYNNSFFFSSGRSYLSNAPNQMRSNLFKYDLSGNVLWSEYVHKNSVDTSRMYTRDLIKINNSQMLLYYLSDDVCTGSCNDYSPGLILIDTSGAVIWDKKYNISASNSEYVEKVNVIGNYIYMSGYTNINNPSNANVFILQTDLSGNLVACNQYGSSTLNEKPFVNNLCTAGTAANGLFYFVYAAEDPNSLQSDINILKVDSTLTVPCYPGIALATTVTSVTPSQTSFTNATTPSVFTTSANTVYAGSIVAACPNLYSRLVDTVHVSGADTVLSALTPTANSYYWNNGNTTYSLYVNSPQVDSVFIIAGCCTVLNHVYYVKFCPLSVSISTTSPICQGKSCTLTASGAVGYTWNPGGLSSGTISVSPPSTTVYSVICKSPGGCTITYTVQQIVTPAPILSVLSTASSLCLGSSLSLTVTGASSYTWLPGLSNNPVLQVSPTGNSSYSVTGSLQGCNSLTTTVFGVNVLANPTVAASASPTLVCTGFPTTLSASGAFSYTWSPGPVTGPNPVVYPPASTVYTVLGNTGGCTDTAAVFIQVSPLFPVNIAPPAAICQGQSSTLTASGALGYTWNPGGLASASIAVWPGNTTVYSVTCIGTAGCEETFTVQQVVNPLPTVVLSSAANTLCAGSTLVFNASGATSYTWLPGPSYGPTIQVSPASTTSYSVVGSALGCLSPTIAVLSVVVYSTPIVAASASPSLLCAGQSATLSASGGSTYTWLPGSFPGYEHSFTPPVSSNYTVIGSNGLCTSTASAFVQVIPIPVLTLSDYLLVCLGSSLAVTASGAQSYTWSPPGAFVSISGPMAVLAPPASTYITLSGANSLGSVSCVSSMLYPVIVENYVVPSVYPTTSICQGQKADLFAGGGSTFWWSPSSSVSSPTTAAVIVRPSSSTVYSVTVSAVNKCPSTATVLVTVNPLPNVFAGNDTTFEDIDQAVIHATGTGVISWIAGTGIVCPGCPITQVHPEFVTQEQCYTAQAANNYGCVVDDEVCIRVLTDYAIYIPNTFTPNGDGLDDLFYVYGYGFSDLHIQVFNRWGELIYASTTNKGWDGTYKGKECPEDTYVYKVNYKVIARDYKKVGHINIIK